MQDLKRILLITITLFILGCNTTPSNSTKTAYTSNPRLFTVSEIPKYGENKFYGFYAYTYYIFNLPKHYIKNDFKNILLVVDKKTGKTYALYKSTSAVAISLRGINNNDYVLFPSQSKSYRRGFSISDNMLTLMPNIPSDFNKRHMLYVRTVIKYLDKYGLKITRCSDMKFECKFNFEKGNNKATFEYIDYNPAINEFERLLANKEYDKALSIKFPDKFANKKVLIKALADTNSKAEYNKVSSIISSLNIKGLKGVSNSKSLDLTFASDYKAVKHGSLQARKAFLADYSYLNQDACYSITASTLNVRSRPNTYSEKVGIYYLGEIVCTTDRKKGWVKTGDGWISIDYITKKNTKSYMSKLQDIAQLIDGGTFDSAVKENTISAYKDYLIDYPAGKHAKEAITKLVTLYESEPSFNNYVRAYLASKKVEYLNKAESNLTNSNAKQYVDLELIDIYFDRKVSNVSHIPNFVSLLEHTKYNAIDFKKKMLALNDFGDHLTLDNVPHSVEYKYLLNKLYLNAKAAHINDTVVVTLSTDGFKKSFTYKADCEFLREDSGVRDTGFLESVFTLGASQAQYFYNVYNCKTSSKAVADAGIFGRQAGFDYLAGEIEAYKPWEYRNQSRDVNYSYNSGSSSSSSSGRSSSVSFFEIQDEKASKGGTQFYTVGCSNGTSGIASVTDVGRSYGSVCASGGNLTSSVCKAKDMWSTKQAATKVCSG